MDKLLSDEISNRVINNLRASHFQIGILNSTTRTKTLLNGGTELSNPGQCSDE